MERNILEAIGDIRRLAGVGDCITCGVPSTSGIVRKIVEIEKTSDGMSMKAFDRCDDCVEFADCLSPEEPVETRSINLDSVAINKVLMRKASK